jgi:hypothetical protein
VRLEVGELEGGVRLFAVAGAACPDDYVRVALGCEPPLYVPPIPARDLLRALHGEPIDLLRSSPG